LKLACNETLRMSTDILCAQLHSDQASTQQLCKLLAQERSEHAVLRNSYAALCVTVSELQVALWGKSSESDDTMESLHGTIKELQAMLWEVKICRNICCVF
jgi:hypothetical protein